MAIFRYSTIYLSQTCGDDKNSGAHIDLPVRSLERAFEIIAEMRRNGAKHPMEIALIGDYFAENGIVLDASTNMSGVTLTSYGNSRARIIGGKRIDGWHKASFNGICCLCADVDIDEDIFTDLYVNGRRAALPRYPEEGEKLLRAVDTEFNDYDELNIHCTQDEGSKWFIAHKEDLEGLENIEDGIVSFYHCWVDEHSPIESYDGKTGKLTLKLRTRFRITTHYEQNSQPADIYYYIENLPVSFKNKGEWYLDRKNKKCYYIPFDTENESNIEAFAPTVTNIIKIKGTLGERLSNIRIKDIDIMCSKGDYSALVTVKNNDGSTHTEYRASDSQSVAGGHGAVEISYAHHCSIENCNISNTGMYAVAVLQATNDIIIENCKMHDLGAGGVKFLGERSKEAPDIAPEETLEQKLNTVKLLAENVEDAPEIQALYNHHNSVRGCTIMHCGQRYAAACGIIASFVHSCEFSDNEIAYTNYSGISCGWSWGYKPSGTSQNIIKNNHIHHIGLGKLSDLGGIYLLGIQKGTVVSGNRIHDVESSHYGGCGIYLDEGATYITVENNIVYRTKAAAYNHNYSAHNVAKNNIFAFAYENAVWAWAEEEQATVLFTNNIILTNSTPVYPSASRRRPCLPNFISDNNFVWDISSNEPVFAYIDGEKVFIDEWREISSNDANTHVFDPMVNYADDSFKIDESSPVFKLGFKRI